MAASERATKKMKELQLKKSNTECFVCGTKVGGHRATPLRAGGDGRRRRDRIPLAARAAPCAQGSNYAVMEIGIFVCQVCGGLWCVRNARRWRTRGDATPLARRLRACPRSRDFELRAKGISMSNFSDEEADFFDKHGNKRLRPLYWAHFDPAKNPKIPVGASPRRCEPSLRSCRRAREVPAHPQATRTS